MSYTTFAVVMCDERYGFLHINTRLNRATKADLKNVRERGLPYTPYEDYYANVTFNIQYNNDDNDGGYGFQPAMHDIYNVGLEQAENTLKLLRKVDKGYNKLRNESDNTNRWEALPSLIAFLKAANVKRVFIRKIGVVGFDNLSLEDAIVDLANIDNNFTNRV